MYVYHGGVSQHLRSQVWPYLLGHYCQDCDDVRKQEIKAENDLLYEATMAEWRAVETVIEQRPNCKSRFSYGSSSDNSYSRPIKGLPHQRSSVISDVFLPSESTDSGNEPSAKKLTVSHLMTFHFASLF